MIYTYLDLHGGFICIYTYTNNINSNMMLATTNGKKYLLSIIIINISNLLVLFILHNTHEFKWIHIKNLF